MDRTLETETVDGEIALVIGYLPGESSAIDVLSGAMSLIAALDGLDHALLSSIDTNLEPVSILNDIQHSSLKILLARALKGVSDDAINNLEWKKWVGSLLVKGKHWLLARLDADSPEINRALIELSGDYKSAPSLIGYDPPSLTDVRAAMDAVSKARANLSGQEVKVQTEHGDIILQDVFLPSVIPSETEIVSKVVNRGKEFFKVKTTDMLGNAQWTVIRNGRAVKVDILHREWLDKYQQRATPILPGDSLECVFEETVFYDACQNELERKLAVIEVVQVITPPVQKSLI